jgi:ComF family protein
MPTVIERVSRLALDLLFPPQCALCRRTGSMLCDQCASFLPAADGDRCARCGGAVTHGAVCRPCDTRPPAFELLRSAFVMEEGARDLVHALKYNGMSSLAETMAAPVVTLIREEPGLAGVDLVVPIPLHRGRQRSRGYNQSALLAKHVSRAAGLPLAVTAARRIRATRPLAKSMNAEHRRTIVEGAFAADRAQVERRCVLLIDDVATTGATLDACAKALLEAGAASVRCVTFARAD